MAATANRTTPKNAENFQYEQYVKWTLGTWVRLGDVRDFSRRFVRLEITPIARAKAACEKALAVIPASWVELLLSPPTLLSMPLLCANSGVSLSPRSPTGRGII